MPFGFGMPTELMRPTGSSSAPRVRPSHRFVAWSSRHWDSLAHSRRSTREAASNASATPPARYRVPLAGEVPRGRSMEPTPPP
jgi:hypothetical protein